MTTELINLQEKYPDHEHEWVAEVALEHTPYGGGNWLRRYPTAIQNQDVYCSLCRLSYDEATNNKLERSNE